MVIVDYVIYDGSLSYIILIVVDFIVSSRIN
jgi:hypothetical protein